MQRHIMAAFPLDDCLGWGTAIRVGRISEASSAIGRGGKVRRMALRLSALRWLHGQFASSARRLAGGADRCVAGSRAAGACPGAFSYRCVGGVARPHALPVDVAGRRRRFPRPAGGLSRPRSRNPCPRANCGHRSCKAGANAASGSIGIGNTRSAMIGTTPFIWTTRILTR